MTLDEFRELTKGLDGGLELCCGGASVSIVWNDGCCVSIDDDVSACELSAGAAVLYSECEPMFAKEVPE